MKKTKRLVTSVALAVVIFAGGTSVQAYAEPMDISNVQTQGTAGRTTMFPTEATTTTILEIPVSRETTTRRTLATSRATTVPTTRGTLFPTEGTTTWTRNTWIPTTETAPIHSITTTQPLEKPSITTSGPSASEPSYTQPVVIFPTRVSQSTQITDESPTIRTSGRSVYSEEFTSIVRTESSIASTSTTSQLINLETYSSPQTGDPGQSLGWALVGLIALLLCILVYNVRKEKY